ncbi:MAG: T9SS type A sorting domain-containing protein [Bacteroidota bacterium]
MRQFLILLTTLLFIPKIHKSQGFAPGDTILVYDVITHTLDTILPVTVDPSITFDYTSSSIGSMGNQVPLSLTPPTSNLFSNSSFSKITRAELSFDVTQYPMRTAAALRRIDNGDTAWNCSGIMVAPDYYMTAGHCIYNYFSQPPGFYTDSFLVAPGYDNGKYQTSLPTSMVDKIYVFKRFYDRSNFIDVALVHLQQPIGYQIGWTGMAFSSDTSYFTGKVFHKFSYPGQAIYPDTTHYNGDTLFYNYGHITQLNGSTDLGVLSPQAWGISGQSGSTFLYTDNIDYYSFGVFNFSAVYRHYQIDNYVFYQFKQLLDGNLTRVNDIDQNSKVKMYPNPCTTSAVIKMDRALHNAELTIMDLYGREVKHLKHIEGLTINFSRENMVNGIYVIRLTEDHKTIMCSKLVVTE